MSGGPQVLHGHHPTKTSSTQGQEGRPSLIVTACVLGRTGRERSGEACGSMGGEWGSMEGESGVEVGRVGKHGGRVGESGVEVGESGVLCWAFILLVCI